MSREPNFQPRGIRFDKTITAGNLLTVIGGIIALAGAYVDYRVNMDRHDLRIAAAEASVSLIRQQLADTVKAQTDTARAIDRLTFQLQMKDKQQP